MAAIPRGSSTPACCSGGRYLNPAIPQRPPWKTCNCCVRLFPFATIGACPSPSMPPTGCCEIRRGQALSASSSGGLHPVTQRRCRRRPPTCCRALRGGSAIPDWRKRQRPQSPMPLRWNRCAPPYPTCFQCCGGKAPSRLGSRTAIGSSGFPKRRNRVKNCWWPSTRAEYRRLRRSLHRRSRSAQAFISSRLAWFS